MRPSHGGTRAPACDPVSSSRRGDYRRNARFRREWCVLPLLVLLSACDLNLSSNTPPEANAGPDMAVNTGEIVELDGTGSDADGDPLIYTWSFASKPTGSVAELVGANLSSARFVPDAGGPYRATLTVSDGEDSDTDECMVSANGLPVARAGGDRTVNVGETVQLDGTGSSDPDGSVLSYSWHLRSHPAGSIATLERPTSATPMLTPDVEGSYVVRLVVSDGVASSTPDDVTIRARETVLFLRSSSATGHYLSALAASSGSTRITFHEAGASVDFVTSLMGAVSGGRYGFSLWLGAGSSAGQTGRFGATILVDDAGIETVLANHTFTVPFDTQFVEYTASVNGIGGGAPGDELVLRLTMNSASQGGILFGASPIDSHVRLPGDLSVSLATSAQPFGSGPEGVVTVQTETGWTLRYPGR